MRSGIGDAGRQARGTASGCAPLAGKTGLPAETADAPADSASTPLSATTHPKQPIFDPIAERLKYLHDRLRITPAQEPLWADLARVIQDNAKAVAPLIREQLQVTKNRTAVETLDIYKRLGKVQLEGLKNLLAAFRALYDKLSDQQKKIADVIFRTSPLSMVGGIPKPPQELVELPLSSPPTSGAYPPSVEPLPYPPYAYLYYPYYPWPITPGLRVLSSGWEPHSFSPPDLITITSSSGFIFTQPRRTLFTTTPELRTLFTPSWVPHPVFASGRHSPRLVPEK